MTAASASSLPRGCLHGQMSSFSCTCRWSANPVPAGFLCQRASLRALRYRKMLSRSSARAAAGAALQWSRAIGSCRRGERRGTVAARPRHGHISVCFALAVPTGRIMLWRVAVQETKIGLTCVIFGSNGLEFAHVQPLIILPSSLIEWMPQMVSFQPSTGKPVSLSSAQTTN